MIQHDQMRTRETHRGTIRLEQLRLHTRPRIAMAENRQSTKMVIAPKMPNKDNTVGS